MKNADQNRMWTKKTVEIKAEIKKLSNELSALPNLPSARIAAGEAKTRLESFIHLNGGDEGAVPSRKKGQLASLKEDWEDKTTKANTLIHQRKELTEKLERLNKELIRLNALGHIDEFSTEGLKAFVSEATEPILDEIRSKASRLSGLLEKKNALKKELSRDSVKVVNLSEDDILGATIDGYSDALSNLALGKNRREAIKELVGHANKAIHNVEGQLQADFQMLTSTLAEAVNAYTLRAAKKLTKDLKKIFDQDKEYAHFASALYEGISRDAVEGTNLIFPADSLRLRIQSRLISDSTLSRNIGNYVSRKLQPAPSL